MINVWPYLKSFPPPPPGCVGLATALDYSCLEVGLFRSTYYCTDIVSFPDRPMYYYYNLDRAIYRRRYKMECSLKLMLALLPRLIMIT